MQVVQTRHEEITVPLVMPRMLNDSEMTDLATFIHGNFGHPFR
jgi:hypothetical protein